MIAQLDRWGVSGAASAVARTGPADLLERAARRRVADRDPEYCVLLRILALLVRSRVDDVLATHATTVACCLAAARLSLLPPVRLQPGNPEADLAFNRSLVSMHGVAALLAGTRMIGRASAAGSSCAAVPGVESGRHPDGARERAPLHRMLASAVRGRIGRRSQSARRFLDAWPKIGPRTIRAPAFPASAAPIR